MCFTPIDLCGLKAAGERIRNQYLQWRRRCIGWTKEQLGWRQKKSPKSATLCNITILSCHFVACQKTSKTKYIKKNNGSIRNFSTSRIFHFNTEATKIWKRNSFTEFIALWKTRLVGRRKPVISKKNMVAHFRFANLHFSQLQAFLNNILCTDITSYQLSSRERLQKKRMRVLQWPG